jgi:hypothetical protein
VLIVMPRWRSSGAASIELKSRTALWLTPWSARTFEMAAVSVVLPWSM